MQLSTVNYMKHPPSLEPIAHEIAAALVESGIATDQQAEAFVRSLLDQATRQDDLRTSLRSEETDERELISGLFDRADSDAA
jgi:hypothetical protein